MRLAETFTLPKTSRYANPESDGYYLPYVYGNCSTVGGWQAQCIDTVNFYYCIAAHPILTVANGNTVTVFDSDGNEISSGFTIVESEDIESQGEIAYLDFTSDPEKDIFVRCQGKPDSAGTAVIENPIDILEDWLTEMDIDEHPNLTAFAKAKQIATDEGFTAGGLIMNDNSGMFWFLHLLSSFLGDVWINHKKEIMVSLDLASSSLRTYNHIVGWLSEKRYEGSPEATRKIENLVNQPEVFFAPNYTQIDRRFSEGAKGGNFDGYDDGSTYADTLSQAQYGVCKPTTPIELNWIRTAAVAALIQQRIIALYKDPLWLMTVTERGLRNIHVERGEYVVGSWKTLRDEENRELVNQIWQVLEIEKNLDTRTIRYLLKDTGYWYPIPPITYNGDYYIGHYSGRTRDRRRMF